MSEEEKQEIRQWAEALSDHFTSSLSELYTQLGLDDLIPTEHNLKNSINIENGEHNEN